MTLPINEAERRALRLAFLTAPIDDVPMSLDEAAVFVDWSPNKLEMSNAPRAKIGNRVVFLRSQLILFIKHNHTIILDEVAPTVPALRSA